MKRLFVCFGVVVTLALGLTLAGAATPEDPASVKDIMKALHKGAQAPLTQLKTALKSDSPDWTAVQSAAKVYAKFAPDLAKNDAPKGDSADFKKLSEAFEEAAKKLNTAATDKNLTDARDAFQTLAKSCMECHKAHKP